MLTKHDGEQGAAQTTDTLLPKQSKKPLNKGQCSLDFADDYAPALESTQMVSINSRYGLFIDGKQQAPLSEQYFATINPATAEPLAEIAVADQRDVDKAVQSSRKAYEKVWSKLSPAKRGRYLYRIARILQERAKEFAVLETIDGGKPIKESRDIDIPLAAAHFFYYAGWADKLDYAYPGKSVRPLGVCGQVIPWNFPLLMAAWKLAPALACGNTCVLKPAETTPLTALLLAEVLQEAELPDGVVNIITGAGETGSLLCQSHELDKVAFTGSTDVGKLIAKNLASRGTKLSLELGGKSAHIVFKDAAIDQAVEGVINGIYFNQGHVCCAGSRLLLEESIAELFVDKLKARMQHLRVGNPLDKNTDIGAINSKAQWERINTLIKLGKDEPGGFYQLDTKLPEKGYFIAPCFFTEQSSSNSLSQVEVFGPVLSIMTFRTPEEAVLKANNTHYGLAAGIWSEKGAKVRDIASKLNAGVIWANTYNKFDPSAPFGGFKESGYGREGGLQGLHPYLEVLH